MYTLTWCPAATRARGKAPTTSARPPVLEKGTHSDAAKAICMQTNLQIMTPASSHVMIERRYAAPAHEDSRLRVQCSRPKERGSMCRKYPLRVLLRERPNWASIFSPTLRPHYALPKPSGICHRVQCS